MAGGVRRRLHYPQVDVKSNPEAIAPDRSGAPPRRVGPGSLALAALGAFVSAGCVTDDQVSFPLSRSIYLNQEVFPRMTEGLASDPKAVIDSPEAAALFLGLPLAIDLALLPFTLTWDICLGNW